ncbi:MAG: phosphate/phosphite/phosphonate ABC transporter substrate-binding protein [Spirulinaceae cyanobacterium SM2_1_0]|nr:phosphate/phosphite/phosphonate ABC transporter substrate-binding protein [Spirulinaceae cyanobacterium SM2_1_0]
MKRRRFLWYAALFTAGCSSNNLGGSGSSDAIALETIRFSVTDVLDAATMENDFGVFREILAEVLGVPVEFVVVDNMPAATSALQLNEIDLALVGPSEYVQIRSRTNAEPIIAITRPGYQSVIVAPADSDIKTMADLQGKTLALSDVGSTSGHIGPTILLLEADLDPKTDLEVQMLGDDGSVEALKNGTVDAWGGSLLDRNTYLPDFPFVVEGPPLPNDLIIASSQLAPDAVTAIRQRLLDNRDRLLAALVDGGETEKYAGSELVEAKDTDYDPIRKAYEAMGESTFAGG